MKIASLKGQRAFERVSRDGRRFSKEFIQLRVLENSLTSNRIGIVIPEKAIAAAVDRNRVRRLIKEAYHAIANRLKDGYDIVFIVREKPQKNKMDFVLNIINEMINRAGLVRIASKPEDLI